MNHQSNSHNGCRVSNLRDSFEWWYFDIDLRNHFSIHIEWHSPIFNYKDCFNTLVVRIYNYKNMIDGNNRALKKSKWIKAFRYHRSTVFQSHKACEIIFPSGYIKEENGNYFINILEEDLRIDLKLTKLLPSLSIEDEMLYRTRNKDEYLCWYIPVPKAAARGEIEIDGNCIEAVGISYHDHNWGNLNLRRYLQGWLWIRIFFKDFTLIFWDINTNNPEEKVRVLLFQDQEGHNIDTKLLKVDYKQFDNQNQYRIETPQTFSVQFGDEERYHIVFQRKRKFVTTEVPLISFNNNFLNLWLIKIYHLFRFCYAPNIFRKWFGRLLYFQSEIIGELYHNGSQKDKQIGKIEVISFAS